MILSLNLIAQNSGDSGDSYAIEYRIEVQGRINYVSGAANGKEKLTVLPSLPCR